LEKERKASTLKYEALLKKRGVGQDFYAQIYTLGGAGKGCGQPRAYGTGLRVEGYLRGVHSVHTHKARKVHTFQNL
jgi:hypothetical protein